MAQRYDDLTREQLIALLEERDQRRLGLVWERDPEVIGRDAGASEDFIALRHDPNLSSGPEPSANLIIEGDNHDALRLLRMTHAGRVKCIYIDPPYNTGNRDFVYNDRFVDKEHAWRHSLWIEFMHRRLTLARDLLAPDGAIFVSIDDNELFHLGMIMNEVFGEENFLCNFIWQHSQQPKGYSGKVSVHHNFILTYRMSNQFRLRDMPRTEDHNRNYSNPDGDPRGAWRAGDVRNALFRPNLRYDLVTPSGKVIPAPAKGWRWSRETMADKIATGEIVFRDDETRIVRKIYLHGLEGRSVESIWYGDAVGTTREANGELKAIFGGESHFETPKPVRLIERVLQIACGPTDLVLDFFAGSGTTAHAVLKLNAEDGGRRRFILVSNTEATLEEPVKNLCRDVCAERVRRVIDGYSGREGKAVPGLGGSFSYLRVERIPPGKLIRRLAHEQVWTALQLMHLDTLDPRTPKGPVWSAGPEPRRVLYVPRVTEDLAARLASEFKAAPLATLYAWQADSVQQLVPQIAVRPIPQFLAEKLGVAR